MNYVKNNPLRISLPCIVFVVLSFFIYFPAEFFVSWDLSTYLVYAQNFLHGFGFSDPSHTPMDSRPGYTLMLAALYAIFGNSIAAIAIFETLWAVIFITGLLAIALRLLPRNYAIFSTLLFLLSPQMIFWLPRHLDQIWPALLLWSLYTLITPRQAHSFLYGCCAGLLAGLAFIIKEMAVFFCLIPLILLLTKSLAQDNNPWRKCVGFYTVLIAVLAVYFFWLSSISLPDSDISGKGRYTKSLMNVMKTTDIQGLWNLVIYTLHGGWLYFFSFESGLIKYIPAIPLFVISVLALIKDVFKRPEARVILACLAVYFPFMALCGQTGLRVSQILFAIAILYIALGMSLALLLQHQKLQKHSKKILVLTFIGLLVFQGVQTNNTAWKMFKRYNIAGRALTGKPAFATVHNGIELQEFFSKNIDTDDSILISEVSFQHGAYWYLGGKTKILSLPLNQMTPSVPWPYYPMATPEEKYNLLTVNKSTGNPEQTPLFLMSAQKLVHTLQDNHVKYIAASNYGLDTGFRRWLEIQPGIKPVTEIPVQFNTKYTIAIYEIPQKYVFETKTLYIDSEASAFLKRLEQDNPDNFAWHKVNTLENTLNLPMQSIRAVLENSPDAHFEPLKR